MAYLRAMDYYFYCIATVCMGNNIPVEKHIQLFAKIEKIFHFGLCLHSMCYNKMELMTVAVDVRDLLIERVLQNFLHTSLRTTHDTGPIIALAQYVCWIQA